MRGRRKSDPKTTAGRKSDARVVEILAAFDRVASSPARAIGPACPPGQWLDGFMSVVASTVADRFTLPCDWPDDAIRAVLLAFLLNAPDEDLDDMVRLAHLELGTLAEVEADEMPRTQERAA